MSGDFIYELLSSVFYTLLLDLTGTLPGLSWSAGYQIRCSAFDVLTDVTFFMARGIGLNGRKPKSDRLVFNNYAFKISVDSLLMSNYTEFTKDDSILLNESSVL